MSNPRPRRPRFGRPPFRIHPTFPAPLWPGDVPGEPLAPHPTGNAVFNYPSSMLFAPAVTVPLMSVSGMPVGVQLMGQQHEDARITALARWLLETVPPVVVP